MRILTDKKVQELLKNEFEDLKYDIFQLFVNDYLSVDLILKMYNDIDEYEAYNIKNRKSIKERISKKIEKNLLKIGKKNCIEMLKCCKEILESFDEENGFYEEIWYKLFDYGRKNSIFDYPVDVDMFIKDYDLKREILNQLSKEQLCELYNNYFSIEIKTGYNEYISPSTRVSVSTIKKIFVFKLKDGKEYSVELSKIDFKGV